MRAALVVLPWLLLGAACLGDDSASDDNSEGGGEAVGQNSTANAGTAGSSPLGTGGTTVVTTPAGGAGGSSAASSSGGTSSGGMSSVGGGGQAAMGGSSGVMGPFPAAPGETGVFVGMTAAHNAARAEVSAEESLSPPLPDLTWSQDLADFSQEWADNLANDTNCGTIFHRDQHMYGENIAFRGSSRLTVEYAPEEAVESWVAEVACWEYGTILGNATPTASSESCDPVCIAGQHSSGCGHYTQVIWRNTREVGCGYAQCNDGQFTDEVWVCNYNPPGNFIGQTPY